jgi:hypothetical protein
MAFSSAFRSGFLASACHRLFGISFVIGSAKAVCIGVRAVVKVIGGIGVLWCCTNFSQSEVMS